MKKGLAMLVVAMVITGLVCVIGSAAATHPDAVAATSAYTMIDVVIVALMGTTGVILVVLSRKQIKSVFAKGLDPPAHLTSAAMSDRMQRIGDSAKILVIQ